MKTRSGFVAVAALPFVVAAGCSGGGATSPAHSGPPFLGRWSATLQGAPCAFDVELMDGGAARMNFLNDDSPRQLCSHRDVTFMAGSPLPDAMIFFVGERPVRHCWFAVSGPHLDLACDEHGLPQRGTPPIRFTRVEASPPPSDTTSILGDWDDNGVRFTFLPGDICVVRDRSIGYKILNSHELELQWPKPERCTYEFRSKDELLLKCESMSLDLRR
jgi:hypothetical protein